ncbi:MAG: DUF481 domain-containing protein [bacterium]
MRRSTWIIVLLFIAVNATFPVSASPQIVNTLRGFEDGEKGWSGDLEGTVAVADGNTNYFQFDLAAAVQHLGARNRWRLLGGLSRRTASGEEIAQNRLLHLRHNYRFRARLASIAFIQGQYNPFKRIETRLLVGAGLRFDLTRREKWNAAVGGTVMYETEELTGQTGQFNYDYRYSFFLTVFRDVSEGVSLDISGFYQPLVDDPVDARALAAASVRTDVIGELYLVFAYRLEYDADPPAEVKRLDQNLRSGLGYDF